MVKLASLVSVITINIHRRCAVMSEENKNRNKDKGKQNNRNKHNKAGHNTEFASENSEFLNLDNKKNKRKR